VFRFPRRRAALPGFRRELAVLPRLAPLLPLPVPVPGWVAVDDAVDPWPFAGARLLPGRELAEAGLSDDARRAAAADLGSLLHVLHDPATREAVGLELPVDVNERGRPGTRAESTRRQLRELQAAGVWPGNPAVGRLLAEAEALGPPTGQPVLVHGDLHVRHVLVDDAGRVAGVIDWGDVCLADPAVDLAVAYAAFTGAARRALLAEYGPVDPERELRARALAVRLSAFLAAAAADGGRGTLLAEALAGLDRAVMT
jgi:aminoglycoside phosphotransferase (APT) family kinase protein